MRQAPRRRCLRQHGVMSADGPQHLCRTGQRTTNPAHQPQAVRGGGRWSSVWCPAPLSPTVAQAYRHAVNGHCAVAVMGEPVAPLDLLWRGGSPLRLPGPAEEMSREMPLGWYRPQQVTLKSQSCAMLRVALETRTRLKSTETIASRGEQLDTMGAGAEDSNIIL